MNKIKDLLRSYNIKGNKCTIKKSAVIIDDKYVIKKKKVDNKDLYNYLSSRSFEYYPKVIDNNTRTDYDMYEYINDVKTPDEQKALDIINLVALLHSKTTFYRSVTEDVYKELYENTKKRVDDINDYYNELFYKINRSIYMSPSEYLIIRNISKIFAAIDYCYRKLEDYLEESKNFTKQRMVTLHNNLSLDHFIKNDKSYLISWDNSKIGLPIYDLYVFYQNHYLDLEFTVLLSHYLDKYPLFDEEKNLFLILISIPKEVTLNNGEMKNIKIVNKSLEYTFRSEKIVKFFTKKVETTS